MIKIESLAIGPVQANCYIVTDSETRDIAVIDSSEYPGDEDYSLGSLLAGREKDIKYILLTHGHFDHLLGVYQLNEAALAAGSKPKVCIHEADAAGLIDPTVSRAALHGITQRPVFPDIILKDGDVLPFGKSGFNVLHTPGHTSGCVCYMIDGSLFTGDTLFRGSIGRYDLPTGDYSAMKQSLSRLKALDFDYTVYPGHGAFTTLNAEKSSNFYLQDDDSVFDY